MYTCMFCGIELSKESLNGRLQRRGRNNLGCQVCRAMWEALTQTPYFRKIQEQFELENLALVAKKTLLISGADDEEY